jgi:hypothetical protein
MSNIQKPERTITSNSQPPSGNRDPFSFNNDLDQISEFYNFSQPDPVIGQANQIQQVAADRTKRYISYLSDAHLLEAAMRKKLMFAKHEKS